MVRHVGTVLLALCLVLVGPVACSPNVNESDGGQPDEKASGSGSAITEKVRMVPEVGDLSAARYSTGESFEPSFSFEPGEGWLVLRSSGPQSLKLGYVAAGQEVAQGKGLRFLRVRQVFEPREQGDDVSFEARPAPNDLVAWLRRHPYLDAQKPETVSVGRVRGEQFGVEVTMPEGYRNAEGNGCALPCLPLFRFGDGSDTYLTARGQDRFIVLDDVKDDTVTIIISASAGKFEEFLPEAHGLLNTVEW